MSGSNGDDVRWGGSDVLSAWESLMWRVEGDRERFRGCLREGFDEVLALGDDAAV